MDVFLEIFGEGRKGEEVYFEETVKIPW